MKINFENLTKDLIASIVVFLVALPFSMGVALASGLPASYGIIGAIVGGLVVGSLAGAPLMVTGPAAGLVVVVWEVVDRYGVKMIGPVVLIAGFLQIIGSVLRLGRWFQVILPSVIYGMLAGIGILMIFSQVYVLFDYQPSSKATDNIWGGVELCIKLFTEAKANNLISGALGILTLSIIFVWNNKIKYKNIPGVLIAVVSISFIACFLFPEVNFVKIPENILSDLSLLSWDIWLEFLTKGGVYLDGLLVALVASAQAMLSVGAVDRIGQGKSSEYNKELFAQGVGNMTCGILGLMPVTGVPVRSVANVQAGAHSRLSVLMQAGWFLVLATLFSGILNKIPVTVLAATLIYVAYGIASIENFKKVVQRGKYSVFIYLSTIVGLIVFNVLIGVLIGFALSIIGSIHKFSKFSVDVIKSTDRNRVDLYLKGTATFISLPILSKHLAEISENVELYVHIENLSYIDLACLDVLANWEHLHAAGGGKLIIEWDELFSKHHSKKKLICFGRSIFLSIERIFKLSQKKFGLFLF